MEKYIPKDFEPTKLKVENLLSRALNNDNNENIMKLDKEKISKYKNDILQQLRLNKQSLKELHKKLKDYRYITDLADLNYGSFIRTIGLKKEEIKLTNGGIVMDIKMGPKGLIIVCRNYRNVFFNVNFDEHLIFQKINEQERILLEVIDYVNKK